MLTASWRWFALLLGVAFVAFWPTYFSKVFAGPDGFTHFHAVLIVAWCAILIAQPWLIASGNRPLHRAIGKLSLPLMLLLVPSSVMLAHHNLNLAVGPELEFRSFVLLPVQLLTVSLFAFCYVQAIRHRRVMAVHSRWIIAGSLTLVDPILARVFLYWVPGLLPFPHFFLTYALVDAILIWLIVRDLKLPAGNPGRGVFKVALGLFVLEQALSLTLGGLSWWPGFVEWFKALPLS